MILMLTVQSLGMVFQQFNLFNNHNVLNNCVVGQVKVLKRSKEEAEKIANEIFKSGWYGSVCKC